jgi:hypothetical protein
MKKIHKFFILLLLVSGCSENKENGKEEDGINSMEGIKRIKEINYNPVEKFGVVEKDTNNIIGYKIMNYDSEGNEIKIQRYDSNGLCEFTYNIEYHSNGNKSKEYKINSEGIVERKNIYNLNKKRIEDARFKSNGDPRRRNVYKYNEAGDKVEQIKFNSDGSITEKIIYVYDSSGNKIEYLKYNSNGELQYKNSYKYDDNNNLLEAISFSSSGEMKNKSSYKYNLNNKQISYERVNHRGVTDWKELYDFDPYDELILKKIFGEGGIVEVDYRYENKYDVDSNKIERKWYISGLLNSITTWSYDDNRNVLEKNISFLGAERYSVDAGMFPLKNTYKYNVQGKEIENNSYWGDGSLCSTQSTTYNNLGSKTSYVFHVLSSNKRDEEQIKYDENNNWILKTKYEKLKPVSVIERVIEYY